MKTPNDDNDYINIFYLKKIKKENLLKNFACVQGCNDKPWLSSKITTNKNGSLGHCESQLIPKTVRSAGAIHTCSICGRISDWFIQKWCRAVRKLRTTCLESGVRSLSNQPRGNAHGPSRRCSGLLLTATLGIQWLAQCQLSILGLCCDEDLFAAFLENKPSSSGPLWHVLIVKFIHWFIQIQFQTISRTLLSSPVENGSSSKSISKDRVNARFLLLQTFKSRETHVDVVWTHSC